MHIVNSNPSISPLRFFTTTCSSQIYEILKIDIYNIQMLIFIFIPICNARRERKREEGRGGERKREEERGRESLRAEGRGGEEERGRVMRR